MRTLRLTKIILLTALLLTSLNALYAGDPGDLINAVKRSQSITDLFLSRWSVVDNSKSKKELSDMPLQDRFYYISRGSTVEYVDLYFNAEIINNIPLSTRFGDYELDMFRAFASTILRFEDMADLGFTKWGFAFSFSGFRYGLKKEINIGGGGSSLPGAGESFTTNEYVYNQMFDDLFVFTNILEDIGYLHTGILLNQQIDPGLDGLIDTPDDTDTRITRFFLNSNLFGTFNLNLAYNKESEKTEFFTASIEIFGLLDIKTLWGKDLISRRGIWPDLYLGYSYFDPQDDLKEPLHTIYLELLYTYYNAFYIKSRADFFLLGRSDIEADYRVKQFYLEVGIGRDYVQIARNAKRYFERYPQARSTSYFLILGISHLTEERLIEYWGNKEEQPEPAVIGFSMGGKLIFELFSAGITLDVRAHKNYAPKIYHLIEAYDQWFFEFSTQIAF